ncbi:MAG: hypothetical protein JO306_01830 [Gemmatimonadetes bacterium]|nr:hypothetical protein [Gemmatimonadota bacterium]
MSDTALLHDIAAPREDHLSERDRRLSEAGVRIPSSATARPRRFAGRRRPKWLAALIRLVS